MHNKIYQADYHPRIYLRDRVSCREDHRFYFGLHRVSFDPWSHNACMNMGKAFSHTEYWNPYLLNIRFAKLGKSSEIF